MHLVHVARLVVRRHLVARSQDGNLHQPADRGLRQSLRRQRGNMPRMQQGSRRQQQVAPAGVLALAPDMLARHGCARADHAAIGFLGILQRDHGIGAGWNHAAGVDADGLAGQQRLRLRAGVDDLLQRQAGVSAAVFTAHRIAVHGTAVRRGRIHDRGHVAGQHAAGQQAQPHGFGLPHGLRAHREDGLCLVKVHHAAPPRVASNAAPV
ncbi:hypothetical protein D3C72_1309860 [compost metagenome]